MTEHEHEHERRADEVEHELDDMAEQSERLEDEIDSTRSDWESKQRDSHVPGADGDPEPADQGDEPEADYPSKG
jgi:predicted  nucleic acid-binding Zn-ribbon protein